jgi:Arc/MetJ-type ribon-helix-helix transcriptional regulator
MNTLQIRLPDELRAIADEQLASGRFRTIDDYVAALIRQDEERRRIEAKLKERMSEPATEMTDADFDRIRERVRAEIATRRAS